MTRMTPVNRPGPERLRPAIARCYSHVSGIAGEALCQWLLASGWVEVERHGGRTFNERITPKGMEGLAGWGVDLARLATSNRKAVCICYEGHAGQQRDHIGAHLGTLLWEWMERKALIEMATTGFRLTPAGIAWLQALEPSGLPLVP